MANAREDLNTAIQHVMEKGGMRTVTHESSGAKFVVTGEKGKKPVLYVGESGYLENANDVLLTLAQGLLG
jgi:hypothetical protein